MGKKILLCVSSMHSGGAERVAATLANAWTDRGDEVCLLITYSGRGGCFYPLSERVVVRYLSDEAGGGKKFWARAKRLLGIRRVIEDFRPDFVVSLLTNVNVAVLLATLGLRVPVIVSEHTYPGRNRSARSLELARVLTYPLARYVTMLTQEGVDWLKVAIPKARGVVIPNPVAIPEKVAGGVVRLDGVVSSSRKLLLSVGRLVHSKGHKILLEVFARLATDFPDWDLVVLGEGPLRSELELRRGELGLDARVFFPGNAGNVGDWYLRADLFVMSSLFEGFPMTLGEAMACGCAVVSYDCDTGPRDMIINNESGVLVSPVGDVGAMREALRVLMSDSARRAQFGSQAIHVGEKFSVSSVLGSWDRLFEKV